MRVRLAAGLKTEPPVQPGRPVLAQNLQVHGQLTRLCPLLRGPQEFRTQSHPLGGWKQYECVDDERIGRPLEPSETGLLAVADDDDEAGISPSAREELVLERCVEATELTLDDIPVGAVVRGTSEQLIGRHRGPQGCPAQFKVAGVERRRSLACGHHRLRVAEVDVRHLDFSPCSPPARHPDSSPHGKISRWGLELGEWNPLFEAVRASTVGRMSSQPPLDEHLVAYYTSVEDEAGRLALPRNQLEFVRTQELLRQRLPAAPARVLDVGGGTGAHAAWLAGDGYEVALVDVVPEHVRQARELSAGLTHGFSACVGDARSLDAATATVDACLLLGPLYHLPQAADRAAALAEARRVTRPGGLVAAASISRYAWPLYQLRDGRDVRDLRSLARTMATGRHDGPTSGFTTAYSHQPGELSNEFAEAGLVDVEVVGVEGPGWTLFARDLAPERVRRLVAASLRVARLYDGYPDMAGASAHLLACGRVA